MTSLLTPTRRALLGGLAATPFLLPSRLSAQMRFADYPFTLGVASGSALADGFVLWTRLAPSPMEPQGGMPLAPVAVDWQVAEDDGFKTIVAKGTETAYPELGHAVHAEVSGLKPGRPYWYRFQCGGEKSLTGLARTLPAAGAALDKVRFAAVGCQHFEAGWYTAYRHVAEESLDFVFHYGDYIYEYHPGTALDAEKRPIDPVRLYATRQPFTLGDYRIRYAQETLDADLQAARAAHPWFCTYDDHEIQNNWAGVWDQNGTPPELFVLRRRQALQAWYEHMPVRRSTWLPDGTIDFHSRADYGDLVRMHFPNTRLYRTDQPCGDNFKPACAGMNAPGAQMIDAAQEKWLGEGFGSSRQRWQGLAQQVMMAPLDRRSPDETEGPVPILNMDSWAGYPAQRERLFAMFGQHRNVVVVTGDEHQNYAIDLTSNGRTVASEFVSTSISSGGDGHDIRPGNEELMRDNANLKWTNDRRGYVLSEITPEAWTGHYRTLDSVTQKGVPVKTAAKWAIEAGKVGLVSA